MKPGAGISIIKGTKCRLSIDIRRPAGSYLDTRCASLHIPGRSNLLIIPFTALSLLNISFNITYCAVVFLKSSLRESAGLGWWIFICRAPFTPRWNCLMKKARRRRGCLQRSLLSRCCEKLYLPGRARAAGERSLMCVWIFRCKCTLV
jgi:hypothetical protein